MLRLIQIFWWGLCADPSRALRGLYWFCRGKRLRGTNLLKSAAAANPDYYQLWIRVAEPQLLEEFVAGHGGMPLPAVHVAILNAAADSAGATQTLGALREALGPALVQLELDPQDRIVGPIGSSGWFFPVVAGDLVSPALGRVLAAAAARHPEAEVVFWDEDRLSATRRTAPWAKGAWDELVFLARDGIIGAAAFKLGSGPHPTGALDSTDLMLQQLAGAARAMAISHLPLILTHRATRCPSTQLAARAERLARVWPECPPLAPSGTGDDILHATWPATEWPAVSIVIPTRDRVELLRSCLSGLERLAYPGQFEIIIADNGSTEAETRQFLADFVLRGGMVVDCAGEFNFSAINNRAVRAATGALVCLLNNDVEPLDGVWLEAMVRHALRPEVGAVGAMLLYPDGSIQHAGVALGIGGAAGHIYRSIDPASFGNGALHRTTRRVSIVTAACLVVRRDLYLDIGGLDEESFAVAFNDVDFCLRLDRAGLRNIYVAEACLIHHESKSRGSDMHASNHARYRRELAALQNRWGSAQATDPWHSPLIGRSSEDFVLQL